MNNTINKQLLERIILERIILESGRFSYDEAYQISWEYNCNFELVKEIIDKLIANEKIKKRYFNPYENITADVPIGNDSYEIFLIKNKFIDINKLMK